MRSDLAEVAGLLLLTGSMACFLCGLPSQGGGLLVAYALWDTLVERRRARRRG